MVLKGCVEVSGIRQTDRLLDAWSEGKRRRNRRRCHISIETWKKSNGGWMHMSYKRYRGARGGRGVPRPVV